MSISNRRSSSLTPAQHEAVHFGDGPLLILAGPGSGKTRVITQRVVHLLGGGAAPHQILALTFTNKAADEMRKRIGASAPGPSVWVSTFHRFCSRLLRQQAGLIGLGENFTVYDTADSLRTLKAVIDDEQLRLVHFTPERMAHTIRWAKNNLIAADQYVARPGDALGALMRRIYPAYQRRLLASNAVDFDDLLLHVVRLLRENPEVREDLDQRFRYILVDEYQDTNLAQYAIVRALSHDYPNLSVTGDPDQSIYGWRGANVNNILDFEKDFPRVRVVRLEHNFRSTGHIVRVAQRLISHNVRRKDKDLITDNRDGPPVRLVEYADQEAEASGTAQRIATAVRHGERRPRDIAVFYRVNVQSRTLEHALADRGLPYQIVNGTEFYQRSEVKDVLAYLQLLNNPRDDTALLRVINTPPRGIGRKTIERLSHHARRQSLSLLDAARDHQQIESLSTHATSRLSRFVDMVDRLQALYPCSAEEMVGSVLRESGYEDCLRDSDAPQDREKLDNIAELVTAARQYDDRTEHEEGLDGFLEQVALASDTDGWHSQTDKVTLMTLHAAKGLEFPVVYVIGVEHGLIPHERSRDNDIELEEERRLLFVGITRAEEELQLSFTKRRMVRGVEKTTIPSQFLMELPRMEMHLVDASVSEMPRVQSDSDIGHQDPESIPVADSAVSHIPASTASFEPNVTPQITTAAALAAGAASSQPLVGAKDLRMGMLVTHPDYGLGKVIAVDGSGSQQTVKIQFFAPPEQRVFRVRHSPLTPIRAGRPLG